LDHDSDLDLDLDLHLDLDPDPDPDCDQYSDLDPDSDPDFEGPGRGTRVGASLAMDGMRAIGLRPGLGMGLRPSS